MTISTKLSEKDFIKASLAVLYSRVFTKIYFGIACFVLLVTMGGVFFTGRYSDLITPLIIVVGIPLLIVFSIKRNYAGNQRIKELIAYSFDKEFLYVRGESFNSELSWNKLPKVTKTKHYLLIWQSKQVANVIPRRDISDAQIAALKEILNEQAVKTIYDNEIPSHALTISPASMQYICSSYEAVRGS